MRRLLTLLASTVVLFAGVAHADNDFVFRYKSAIVNADQGGGDAGNDGGDESGSEDDGPSGSNVGAVTGIPDYDNMDSYHEDDDPEPSLSLVSTGGTSTVGPSRIIYQCFKASGGWGNYNFMVDPFVGDTSWIESYDVVMRTEVGSSAFQQSWIEEFNLGVAPAISGGSLGVTSSGEGCIRIKVKENAVTKNFAKTMFYVNDYPDTLVSSGHVSEDDIWNYTGGIDLPVTFKPDCGSDCALPVPDELEIFGPDEITVHLGETVPLPWHAEGDPYGLYYWGLGNMSGDGAWIDFVHLENGEVVIETHPDPLAAPWYILRLTVEDSYGRDIYKWITIYVEQ